ncbi:gamma-aminobutyric acid receptor exp-1-like [Diorhabda sublineata]|uniref:gamma-aminobutyric acid receptor exp-1-like n=1 Tax=Diorhabda sublineata TaxID=1163346 RepID=UPI0024E09FDA|nr:gamma-aminobutyric acid receptor exp-1-like [Diorhabda sublineata]
MLMGSAVSLNLPEMNRPVLQEVVTTIVTLSLTVEQIVIEDHHLVLNVYMLVNENWLDPRLGPNDETRNRAVSGKIWDPKITNLCGEQSNENLENTIFWRGYGDGDVVLSKKMKIRNQCTTNLHNFPFDTQICEIKLGSYRFKEEEVVIKWKKIEPVVILNEIKSNEFYLENVSVNVVLDIRPTGNFSSGLVEFAIKRNPKHYFISIGLPCAIIVALNYFSLWIKSKKFYLNLLSVIVHFYFYHLSTCRIYPVSYFKHLDISVGISTSISILIFIQSLISAEIQNDTFLKNQLIVKRYINENSVALLSKISYPIFYFIIILINYSYS